MAWKDPVYGDVVNRQPGEQRSALDLSAFDRATAASGQRQMAMDRTFNEARSNVQATRMQGKKKGWQDAEFAFDEQTGDFWIMGDTGQLQNIGQSPATLFGLAGKKLRKIPGSMIPQGTRPVSEQTFNEMLASAPAESDFWGEFGSSAQSTIGLAAAGIDAMIGNDDPSNAWSRAKETYREGQTLGQYKASEAPWYTPSGFTSGLGETLGNIGGSAAMAIPLAAAGTYAGGPGGTVAGAAFGLSGAASAAGDQATSFYANAMLEMEAMTESELLAESSVYRRARAAGMDDMEARRETAAAGARATMLPAASVGMIEGIVGARLGAGVLRRLTAGRVGAAGGSLFGQGIGRRSLAAVGGGVAAGSSEVAETALGQAAGAAATGIGSDNPLDYASWAEFEAASQGGFLLGFLGGGGGSAARADLGDALSQNAGRQSPNDVRALPAPPTQALAVPPTPGTNWTYGQQDPSVIEGEFTDVTGQPQLAPPPAPRQLPPPAPASQTTTGSMPPEQAQARFVELATAGGIQSPQDLEAAWPELMDLADQSAGFRQVMVDAGLLAPGGMIEMSPEAQDAALAAAQQLFVSAPRLPGMPPVGPRVGNQTAPIAGPQAAPPVDPNAPPFPVATGRPKPAQDAAAAAAQQQALTMQVPAQVESPEPLAPPAERTPDGRPVGVTPAALVNPEPMSPEQARQAAQTRAQRRRRAGAAPSPVDAQTAAGAAPVSPEDVTPSTPEPAGDIAAQVEAMLDPATERSAVFVAPGNEAQIPANLPPDVIVASRRGRGTLLTMDEALANRFKRGKWTDADTQAVLGYSENKTGENVGGVVVQARSPEGNVEAQQLATATPRNVKAAEIAVKRQARKGAQIEVTTPQQVQGERAARAAEPVAALAPKLAAAKERLAGKKKVPTPAERSVARLAERGLPIATERDLAQDDSDAQLDTTRAEALGQEVPFSVDVKGTQSVDLTDRARVPAMRVRNGRGELVELGDSLVVTTGDAGGPVNLRVQVIDTAQGAAIADLLGSAGTKKLSAAEMADLERRRTLFEQLDTLLDATVDRAEAALLDHLDSQPDGPALLDAAKAKKLRADIERRAKDRTRGRKPGRPTGSPLAFVPLTMAEVMTYAKKIRRQAAAELALAVDPARSVFRRVVGDLFPGLGGIEDPALLKQAAEFVSKLSDAELEQQARLRSTSNPRTPGNLIRDSLLGKMAMRGASEVARVYNDAVYKRRLTKAQVEAAVEARAAEEAAAGQPQEAPPLTIVDRPDLEALGLSEKKGRRVSSIEGDSAPEAAARTVEGWIDMLERGGTKVDDDVRVMSVDMAHRLFPDMFPDPDVYGRYASFVVDGKTVHVIAANFDMLTDDLAIEALAHEFGEFAGRQMFNRADQATQDAVRAAHAAWLQANGHLSPVELMRTRSPALLRTLLGSRGVNIDMAYAGEFSEWLADNVARYMLNKPEPRGIVENFFAKIGDFLRSVWEGLRGTDNPDPVVEAMVEAFAAGRMGSMVPGNKAITSAAGNLENFGEPRLGARAAEAIRNKSKAGLREAEEIWGSAMSRDPKDLREGAAFVAESAYDWIMRGKLGESLRFIGLSLTSLDQLVSRFRNTPVGTALRAWADLQRSSSTLANIALQGGKYNVFGQEVEFKGAQGALDRASKLAPRVRERLEGLMHDTTRYRIDPELSFADHTWLHTRDGRPLSADAIAINRNRYVSVVEQWNTLGAADVEGQKVYRELREAFRDLHDKTYEQRVRNINEADLSDRAKKDALDRLAAAHREHKNGPYFPLMRTGSWIVSARLPTQFFVAKDREAAHTMQRDLKAQHAGAEITLEAQDDGTYEVGLTPRMVQFFESQREADRARPAMYEQLKAEFLMEGATIEDAIEAMRQRNLIPDGVDPMDHFVSAAFPKQGRYGGIEDASAFVSELRQKIRDKKDGSMDPMVAKALEEAYIEAMPELSPRASLLPRQNVLGAQKEMLQAYAIRYHGAANMFAQVVYGSRINEQFNKIRAMGREYAPATRLAEVLYRNQKAIAQAHEDTLSNFFQRTLMHVTSFAFLAFSPAYLMMNAMQPSLVTMPMLASLQTGRGTLGAARAGVYLSQAYDGLVPYFSSRAMKNFADELKRLQGQKSEASDAHAIAVKMVEDIGKTDAERMMLRDLLDSGTLDFAFLNTIDDAMRGGWGERKLAGITRLGMAMPQQVETMNRVVTALATFRIYMREQSGINEKSSDADKRDAAIIATKMAGEMVRNTQIDYSALNRPLAFNLPWLRVAAQFKMYVQGMYGLLAQNVARAMIGRVSEEQAHELEAITDPKAREAKRREFEQQNRRQGRAALMYLFAAHGAVGGAMGLGPVTMAAKAAVGATALAFGDEDDEWKSNDQLLTEAIEGVFGEGRAALVAREGISGGLLGIPLAERLGFPNLIDTKYTGIRAGDDGGEQLDKWVLYMAGGAAYANARRLAKGIGAATDEDPYTYGTDALPAALRGVARAWRQDVEGITDSDGDSLIPRQDLSWKDVAVTALGLPTTAQKEMYRERGETKGTVARIRARQEVLVKQYRTSIDDPDEVRRIRDEISEFNRTVPRAFQITAGTLRRSVQAKARRDAGETNRDEQQVREMLE